MGTNPGAKSGCVQVIIGACTASVPTDSKGSTLALLIIMTAQVQQQRLYNSETGLPNTVQHCTYHPMRLPYTPMASFSRIVESTTRTPKHIA